jgi:hypothetical protein
MGGLGMSLEVYYIRGGDKTAPGIAAACGMSYGIRHDYIAYAPVKMLDVDFHSWMKLTTDQERAYFWDSYVDEIRALKPVLALAVDYMHPDQKSTLYRQIDALKPLIETVLVCPKFDGAIEHIPDFCRVALSVPSPTYAGFIPSDLTVLKNRACHLLGGRPEKQADIMRKVLGVGGYVLSTDGDYHAMKAGKGQWFDGGRWIQLRRETDSDTDLCIASGKNIVRYLQRIIESQPILL